MSNFTQYNQSSHCQVTSLVCAHAATYMMIQLVCVELEVCIYSVIIEGTRGSWYDAISYSFSTSNLLQCCILLQCTSIYKTVSLLFYYVIIIKQQGFGLASPDPFLCGLGLVTSTNPTLCNCMLWSSADGISVRRVYVLSPCFEPTKCWNGDLAYSSMSVHECPFCLEVVIGYTHQ